MADQHIIFVHGRNFKPEKEILTENWKAALYKGIARDYGEERLAEIKNIKTSMAYYGDVSNAFLRRRRKDYDESKDVADRKQALEKLSNRPKEDFYNKETYEDLPGKTRMKEFFADMFSTPLHLVGVAENIIAKVAPDMEDYWDPDEEFGSDARWPLTEILRKALEEDEEVLLISHSLGSLISFDVLWKFCYYREYRGSLEGKKVNTLVTLGSPLGNPTVKKNLKGASAEYKRRYPDNIKRWINFAAEDDYICHDQTVADDYKKMIQWGQVDSIVDHRIYNLAERGGKSNPHHGTGYLIHPDVARIVNDWVK